jgi:hypothetical protein
MKKGNMSFDVNEPFFIYVEFVCEVIEDTNNLIAFLNHYFFFLRIAFLASSDNYISNRQNYL